MKKCIVLIISIMMSMPVMTADDSVVNPFANISSLLENLKQELKSSKKDTASQMNYEQSFTKKLLDDIEKAIQVKVFHGYYDGAKQDIKSLQKLVDDYGKRDKFLAMHIKATIARLNTYFDSYNVTGMIEELKRTLSLSQDKRLAKDSKKYPDLTTAQLNNMHAENIQQQIKKIETTIEDRINHGAFDAAANDIALLESAHVGSTSGTGFSEITVATGRLKNFLNEKRPQDLTPRSEKKRFSIFN